MKTAACILIVTAVALTTWASAAPPKSSWGSDWIEHYYQHPSPDKFPEEAKKLKEAGVLRNQTAVPLLAAFFARLFAANESKLSAWLSITDKFLEPDRGVFMIALQFSDTVTARDALQHYAAGKTPFAKYCSEILTVEHTDLRRIQDLEPADIDGCWASFFATGDKDYILPVIRLAATTRPASGDDVTYDLARVSLRKVCSTHPAVVKIKDEFYQSAGEQERKSLDELFSVSTSGGKK